MRVSVIVITRNRSGCFVDVLAALAKQDHPDFEVIIVDSSAGEEKEKSVKLAEQFRAKYVFEPRLGQSLARIPGCPFAPAKSSPSPTTTACRKKLALVPRAKLFQPGNLGLLRARHPAPQRNRRRSLRGSRRAGPGREPPRFKPGEVRFSVGLILQNVGKVFAKHMKGKGLAPWCVGHGSSMSFRKTALDQLGGFDNRLGAGAPLKSGEDIDINYRVLRSGDSIVYEPRAVVRHNHHRMTTEDVLKTRYAYSFGGAALMHENSGNPLMFCMKCGRLLQLFIRSRNTS